MVVQPAVEYHPLLDRRGDGVEHENRNAEEAPRRREEAGLARAEAWRRGAMEFSGLPAQITQQQIRNISIGGAIGTGLFLGTGAALQHGGPLGLVLGYLIMGTVVLCTVMSFGEMVAYQPKLSPVGLATLYVDPALGFALGWNAWYNWAIVLPTEISAAVVLITYWYPALEQRWRVAWTALFLFVAMLPSMLGARWYGKVEVGFTRLKVVTITALIIGGIAVVSIPGPNGRIGVSNWSDPNKLFAEYAFSGGIGQFLGLFSVMLQAAFSYFGSEVPAVAASEVINAKKNIPAALRWVWLRVFGFYVFGAFIISLLVNCKDPALSHINGTASQSPFVIALERAGVPGAIPSVCNAAFILAALSAASSDVYISSRFMFSLAQRKLAPPQCGILVPLPWGVRPAMRLSEVQLEDARDADGDERDDDEPRERAARRRRETLREQTMVLPITALLCSLAVGTLAFMQTTTAQEAFQWLSAMTSAAALQAWIGILYTYLRWYKGARRAIAKGIIKRSELKLNRAQPWLARFAFCSCITVLFFNGWAVFAGGWRLALGPGDEWPPTQPMNVTPFPVVATFVTSYLPIPMFLLFLFGYKLVVQTEMVSVDQMGGVFESRVFDGLEERERPVDWSSLPMRERVWIAFVYFIS